ncbi:MAG: hypothetical protein KDD06_23345 [Phaeodactylibacter sp.]|nr:hypothetical protein [Phaeodactylibacter sp.]MCB9286588.1 hypothetical protein [Lewinellaceae bacterium]
MDKEHLKELIGQDKLEEAFAALLSRNREGGNEAWHNAVLIQHNQFRQYEQELLKGTLSAADAALAKNRLLSALLTLIDEWPGAEQATQPSAPAKTSGKHSRAKWLLIGAVALIGLIVGYSKLNRSETNKETEPPSREATVSEGKPSPTRPLHFPQGNEVTFIFSTGSEISYRLLSGELKSLGGDAWQLSLKVRCSARKGNGVNFWDDTFRLELDEPDAFLAPSSGLNELVENNSFKDGTVSFVGKGAFSSLKIALINPWDKEDIRKLPASIEN